MKEKKIIFKKLTVKETAEVFAAKGNPGNSYKCKAVYALSPGEVAGDGNCITVESFAPGEVAGPGICEA